MSSSTPSIKQTTVWEIMSTLVTFISGLVTIIAFLRDLPIISLISLLICIFGGYSGAIVFIGRRNMYLAASLGLSISILALVSGVFLSDFIRSSLPGKEISICSPSFLGDNSLKSHARVINQSDKDIRFAWIGPNNIEESPFNLHPGQTEDIHRVINDAVCIIDLSSGTMISNPLLSFNQQTIIVSGSSNLKIETYPSNLEQ